jgi:hypothetical protein
VLGGKDEPRIRRLLVIGSNNSGTFYNQQSVLWEGNEATKRLRQIRSQQKKNQNQKSPFLNQAPECLFKTYFWQYWALNSSSPT